MAVDSKGRHEIYDELVYDDDVFYFFSLLFYDEVEIEKAISYFKKLINEDRINTTIQRVYPFSNENLMTLFSNLNFSEKRIATVGSSGDQALNAIFYGAKEVDIVDANVFTEPFVELKIAAIKGLEFDEVVRFFKEIHTNSANVEQTYKKFSNYLPDRAKYFWDNVLLDGMVSKLSNIVDTYFGGVSLYGSRFYVDEQDFELLKQKLLKGDYKLNFEVGEFEDFPNLLNGEYDIILLSNIVDYFNTDFDKQIFSKKFLEIYDKNLKPGGYVQVASSVFSEEYEEEILDGLKGDSFVIRDAGINYSDDLIIQKPKSKQMVK